MCRSSGSSGEPAAGHTVMRCCRFPKGGHYCADNPQQQGPLQQPTSVGMPGPTLLKKGRCCDAHVSSGTGPPEAGKGMITAVEPSSASHSGHAQGGLPGRTAHASYVIVLLSRQVPNLLCAKMSNFVRVARGKVRELEAVIGTQQKIARLVQH